MSSIICCYDSPRYWISSLKNSSKFYLLSWHTQGENNKSTRPNISIAHSTQQQQDKQPTQTHSGTLLRTEHMLGNKMSLNKSKRIEITQGMFYKQSETKTEINRRNSRESINMWKLNTLLSNQWVKGKKVTGEWEETSMRWMKTKQVHTQLYGMQLKQA